jgi:hypothetical protein
LCACSDDDKDHGDDHTAQPAADSTSKSSSGALVVVTERESTDGSSLHYLHVLKEWPSSGELDYSKAVELGEPGVAFVQDGAFFFYHAQAGKEEKITVDHDLQVTRGEGTDNEISFMGQGISGFDAEPVRVSSEIAFMIDEKTAQVLRWNPKKMEIDSTAAITGDDVLERDGLKVQFQLGVAAKSRVFTTANWRSWDTNTIEPYAALAAFNQDSPGEMKIIQDDRCAPSVAIGPFVDQDYVYLVSDATQGYDILASTNKVDKHQCVVRMKPDADEFDSDYFIDLQDLTKSPAIYMAFPMAQHKLLVSLWSPNEDVAKYMTTKDAAWFWNAPPTYDYVIIDLQTKKVTEVDLPLASARSPKQLIVDGENYVQLFREDKGTDLYRVSTDGKTTMVLSSPGSTNVQFLGRL